MQAIQRGTSAWHILLSFPHKIPFGSFQIQFPSSNLFKYSLTFFIFKKYIELNFWQRVQNAYTEKFYFWHRRPDRNGPELVCRDVLWTSRAQLRLSTMGAEYVERILMRYSRMHNFFNSYHSMCPAMVWWGRCEVCSDGPKGKVHKKKKKKN